MSLAPGTRLGPYEVLSSLGAGGMGEVYRARDTRLKRDVALKILPESFAADPERLARFQREAEVLASLNHPHIAAIYGLEDSHGVRALVMELVEGPTLAERIAQGAIPLDEALRVARQIAEALEAAHEQGVIHRDLKPANIKVRSDGTVKVLDFGLAKALERAPAAAGPVSMSPTITTPAVMTGVGVMLGTAAYMSPEQARGQVVDRRADIWSFGCVLYELLTRHPPFPGPTVPDMIAAILDRDPDWTLLPSHTPVGIVRVIQRCLRKDPARRLHHVADVRIEIDEALQAPAMTVATAVFDTTRLQRKAARWKLATAVLATVALVSLFAAAWARVRPVAGTAASGPVLTQVARLTHDPQLSEWPTWSPDRSVIAFASNRSGNFEVYVRRVEGGQDVNVTESPAEDLQPAFSPDGKSIAFVSTRSSRTTTVKIGSTSGMEFRTFGGDIWVLPALGGRARRLAPDGNVPVWDPAGGVIAYVSGPENHRSILTVPAEGGTVTPVLTSEASTWEIVRVQYSPDGRWVSFDTRIPNVFS